MVDPPLMRVGEVELKEHASLGMFSAPNINPTPLFISSDIINTITSKVISKLEWLMDYA